MEAVERVGRDLQMEGKVRYPHSLRAAMVAARGARRPRKSMRHGM